MRGIVYEKLKCASSNMFFECLIPFVEAECPYKDSVFCEEAQMLGLI